MSAPTALLWDSNQTVDGTHSFTATAAGHKTDGFVNGEVPTGGELNYVLNLVALWLSYLSGLLTQTIELSPIVGVAYTGGAGTAAPTTPNAGVAKVHLAVGTFGSGDLASWYIPFQIPLGYKITGVRAQLTLTGNTGGAVLNVYTNTNSASTSVSTTASSATGLQVLSTGAITVNAATNKNVLIGVAANGSVSLAATIDLWTLEVDIAPQ